MFHKIGIICAGDQELLPFLPLIQNCTITEKSMLKLYTGIIEGISVTALYSGVCRTNAAIATQILIDHYGCDAIINAGTAGGMAEKIQLFDTIISTETAYWDVSEDILTEFHPWMKTPFFEVGKELLDLAKQTVSANHFSKVYFGRMITSESFIKDDCRDEINHKYAPLSVDMETAGIAHSCYVNQIPYISVRTITDTVTHSGTETFEENCDKASLISANIVAGMLRELKAKG